MIPYIEQPCVYIGPLRLCAFGVIVAASVLAGLQLGRRRFEHLGLDTTIGESMAWYAIVGGFLGAHLFAVLLYFPRELVRDPLYLLRFWEDISSFGGMLGGLLGMLLFFRIKLPARQKRRPGFFFGTFALLYAPVRFALDFLRVGDARYAGLTPAQYASLAILLISALTLRHWYGLATVQEHSSGAIP